MDRARSKPSSKRLYRQTNVVPDDESDGRPSSNSKSLTKSIQMLMIKNELTKLQIDQGSDHAMAENWREMYDVVSDLHYSAFYGDIVSIKRIIKDRQGRSESSVGVDVPINDGPKLLKELAPSIGENYGKENYAGFFLKTTPLMMAAQQGRLSVVKYLVECCYADVNASDSLGLTPLSLASSFNREDIVKYLLAKHALINVTENRTGMTPIILACVNNHSDMCKTLLSHNANVNIVDKFGRQAIHYAAWNYNLKTVTTLYHHDKRSINVQDNDRNTSLHLLVSDENVDVTVYSFATEADDQHLVDAEAQLAKYGGATADIKRESNRGTKRYGEEHMCLVQMLKLGASINIRNNKGQTPMHVLCSRLPPVLYSQGYLYIDEPTTIQTLLVILLILFKSGCSGHILDFQGRTPYSICVDRKNWLAVKILGENRTIRSEVTMERFAKLEETVAMFGWGNLFEHEQVMSEIEYITSAVLLRPKRDTKVQKMAKRIMYVTGK